MKEPVRKREEKLNKGESRERKKKQKSRLIRRKKK